MNKYSEGKIYKLIDNTNGDVYIGSTCNSLRHRLNKHICHIAEFYANKKKYYCRAACIIMNGDYNIELIKHYPCNNKHELELEETKYIKNTDCINITGNVIVNKEKMLAKNKQYYQKNKEDRATKYNCECGGKYTKGHQKAHLKSLKHFEYVGELLAQ
jgi:hypothetical protein